LWPDPPRRAALLALLALLGAAACGFQPAYGPGGAGAALRGRVGVEAPATPDGFALRARLEDRLGPVASASAAPAATLAAALAVEVEAAAVTPDGAITRYVLEGRAPWRLVAPDGAVLAEGEAAGFTGYSATGSTVATAAAAADARDRLMVLLADDILARLLLLPPEALP
jgi:LPS-assembly lipoprotein